MRSAPSPWIAPADAPRLPTPGSRLRRASFGIYLSVRSLRRRLLTEAKTGVALPGAPVIPRAMIGTHAAQPIGRSNPSRTNIGMVNGEPLDFSRYKGPHRTATCCAPSPMRSCTEP